jgi:hypothetical protein
MHQDLAIMHRVEKSATLARTLTAESVSAHHRRVNRAEIVQEARLRAALTELVPASGDGVSSTRRRSPYELSVGALDHVP